MKNPSEFSPKDLLKDKRVYQFMKRSTSANNTSKLGKPFYIKALKKLEKEVENWQKWFDENLPDDYK